MPIKHTHWNESKQEKEVRFTITELEDSLERLVSLYLDRDMPEAEDELHTLFFSLKGTLEKF